MHNLHLIRVNAESGEESVALCESELMEWGTDNNWRTFGGAVSKSGEVYKLDTDWARWIPEDTMDVQALVHEMLPPEIDKEMARQFLESDNHLDWYTLAKMAMRESERLQIGEKFDVWESELFPYQYDEPGLTDLSLSGEGEPWVVLVDMHS